ncbi:MAG: hypothetical protein A2445_05585 [Candidatus Jacksonbacteria bacterium RIFOXYC2_FULL_44_29]|nr:MAG: Histone acetyltransferase, ELP3 family [Parcubacteria group bacterium GW2011_GWC2_44_22]OGY75986.1 MAG: hypothetical protein A2240_05430 [Candidatus Jacksonbacteria bacterium RIFOXYA2_FULL_43_12]OGY76753.1 MAG: hypothetical protein A2295_00235 [Candidatus Jacksonbacteria bacterium RIFOXYB2_FULL_44_15]OGY79159.1 MAG: hypothetical protein A2445_05585 [Candidatus Jacksonbacteria bacterium RIFOXYC2_FULL_44_29]HBH46329.1 tRNA uridine(34) 5-carboxymethylaminomethyl modification radical SAM/GN
MTSNLAIIKKLLAKKLYNEKDLSRVKRQLARDFNVGMMTNNLLLKLYREALAQGEIKPAPWLEDVLIKRRVRTLSGVAPLAVATKPFPCPGRCIYCPTDARMPKSYLPNQPAAARALNFKYQPYAQVQGRLRAFYDNGHKPEKVELRVLGGTWSYYPKSYQTWFIKELYRGLNEFGAIAKVKKSDLATLQKTNEQVQHRAVGLSIETRPDYIDLAEIKRLRWFGVTKVELGVQHLDQKIIDLIKRDQTKDDVIRATKLLKDAGFKICYHIMPNLPGSTPEADLAMVKELFANPGLKPDQLKIYPCVVLKEAPLYRLWQKKQFQTYDDETLVELLAEIKKLVPPYVRIERIYRDVPTADIASGSTHINIREMVQARLREQGLKCGCIRCREVGNQIKINNEKITLKNLKLFIDKYEASDGVEHFISAESPDRKILYAFARLRFPSADVRDQLPPLRQTAIIRELHTYGQLVPLNTVDARASQHQGLGKKLLLAAEQIAQSAGYAKIAVISGVGVRGYYQKLGYRLEDKFGYMIKKLY